MKPKPKPCPTCLPEWLAAFGDLMSLLLTFFILLLSMATMDAVKIREAIGSFTGTLGILPGSAYMEANTKFSTSSTMPLDSTNNAEGLDEMKEPVAEINQIFASMNQDVVALVESEDGFVIRLPATLLFENKDAILNYEDSKLFLKRISMIIKRMPNSLDVEIRGHTDNQPITGSSYKNNWELSSARAISVLEEMQKSGINASRLHIAGYAETRPIASNVTKAGRSKNKRVDIYLYTNQKFNGEGSTLNYRKSILN